MAGLVQTSINFVCFLTDLVTTGKKRRRDSFKPRPALDSNQLVLLLENLLNVPEILSQTLTQMNREYDFDTRNSEVRHRWCELVIKHTYTPKYSHVRRFLVEDQGMGIYLFGEMVITCSAKLVALAKEVYEEIGGEMDQSTLTTVREILFGEEPEGESLVEDRDNKDEGLIIGTRDAVTFDQGPILIT